MTCPGYNPIFQPQLVSWDPLGSLNCTAYSAAMAADDDSCGAKKPTGKMVRFYTGDTKGGTTLAQVDKVLLEHYGVDLDVRFRYPWSEFIRRVNGGASAILQGGYRPIRDSRFRGSETFSGNHAILVNPGLVAMDPLADGRRTGIYKYRGEAYPESLLRTFASRLNLEPRTDYPPKYLGDGFCYAAFSRDNEPSAYIAHMDAGLVDWWALDANGRAYRKYLARRTGGFTLQCTRPRLYEWAGHTVNQRYQHVSLVKITQGTVYAGRYLAINSPRLTIREVVP